MKYIILYNRIIGVYLLLTLVAAHHVHFYRKDYNYVPELDAFYKPHFDLNSSSWNTAFLACEDEGALLFYPKSEIEWNLVKDLINSNKGKNINVTEIVVGLHDEFHLGEYITVDGHTTPLPLDLTGPVAAGSCITININTGTYTANTCVTEPDNQAFGYVCKKSYTQLCPTVDQEYKYVKSTNKCYKVNRRWKTWDDAMQACFVEGGVLVAIENIDEASAIGGFLSSDHTYLVGNRKLMTRGNYYSVKGQKLDELYQSRYNNEELYDCGAIFFSQSNVYTTTVDCGIPLPYICEMEANQEQKG